MLANPILPPTDYESFIVNMSISKMSSIGFKIRYKSGSITILSNSLSYSYK
jgi:hypothetical protein